MSEHIQLLHLFNLFHAVKLQTVKAKKIHVAKLCLCVCDTQLTLEDFIHLFKSLNHKAHLNGDLVSTRRKTHRISVTKSSRLILIETTAVYSENDSKSVIIPAACEHNAELLNLTAINTHTYYNYA
jgi:hypothetical protein